MNPQTCEQELAIQLRMAASLVVTTPCHISTLPVEILESVLEPLNSQDLKAVRLASSMLEPHASRALFRRIILSSLEKDKAAFIAISKTPRLALLVQEVGWQSLVAGKLYEGGIRRIPDDGEVDDKFRFQTLVEYFRSQSCCDLFWLGGVGPEATSKARGKMIAEGVFDAFSRFTHLRTLSSDPMPWARVLTTIDGFDVSVQIYEALHRSCPPQVPSVEVNWGYFVFQAWILHCARRGRFQQEVTTLRIHDGLIWQCAPLVSDDSFLSIFLGLGRLTKLDLTIFVPNNSEPRSAFLKSLYSLRRLRELRISILDNVTTSNRDDARPDGGWMLEAPNFSSGVSWSKGGVWPDLQSFALVNLWLEENPTSLVWFVRRHAETLTSVTLDGCFNRGLSIGSFRQMLGISSFRPRSIRLWGTFDTDHTYSRDFVDSTDLVSSTDSLHMSEAAVLDSFAAGICDSKLRDQSLHGTHVSTCRGDRCPWPGHFEGGEIRWISEQQLQYTCMDNTWPVEGCELAGPVTTGSVPPSSAPFLLIDADAQSEDSDEWEEQARHAPHWAWAKFIRARDVDEKDEGSSGTTEKESMVYYWQVTGGTPHKGQRTKFWKFTRQSTDEVGYGNEPLEFFEDWGECEGDLAEPTPWCTELAAFHLAVERGEPAEGWLGGDEKVPEGAVQYRRENDPVFGGPECVPRLSILPGEGLGEILRILVFPLIWPPGAQVN